MDTKTKIKKLVITSLFAAIIAVVSPHAFFVGVVPTTLSVFAVLLCGALLPPGMAFSAVALYIAVGAAGLPVFSGYRGGIAHLLGATGGYIVSYPFMALAMSLSVKAAGGRKIFALGAGCAAAMLLCYGFGTVWYAVLAGISFADALKICVLPFVPVDIAKAAGASALAAVMARIPVINKELTALGKR